MMELITDLNELARDEFMNKHKESLQNKVVELQTAVENKEKKVVELNEKYMNEVNLRKSAEASALDANAKLNELQSALSSFQKKTIALEEEIKAYKLPEQEQAFSSSQISFGEEFFGELDEEVQKQALQSAQGSLAEELLQAEQEEALQLTQGSFCGDVFETEDSDQIQAEIKECQHSLSLAVLTEKFSQEQQHSFILEDRVAELEESLHEICNYKDDIEEEATKQQEWLKSQLIKERELNEKLSKESDRTIEELQEKLKDARDINSQLLRWKDEVSYSVNFHEQMEQRYKEIIAQYEIELEETKNGLADIHCELLVLRNEQKCKEEERENELMYTSTPQKRKLSLDASQESVSLNEEMMEKDEDSSVIKYGNQKYRIMLAELIWNGMENLLNMR